MHNILTKTAKGQFGLCPVSKLLSLGIEVLITYQCARCWLCCGCFWCPFENYTLIPTYLEGIMGCSSVGRDDSLTSFPIMTFVATSMKSTPRVFDTKGKEREARRLHSITWRDWKRETPGSGILWWRNRLIHVSGNQSLLLLAEMLFRLHRNHVRYDKQRWGMCSGQLEIQGVWCSAAVSSLLSEN